MKDWIGELKSRCDIVSIIGSYVSLTKKGGKNYWGRCPFHNENTPSFCVNAEGQFYKCFGCGKSGDVISFVSDIEHLSFMESCALLAEKVNFELPETINNEEMANENKKKEIYIAIMNEACRHYEANLYTSEGQPYLKYILSRNIRPETIKAFRLGASLGGSKLLEHLQSKGFSSDDIFACGILGEKDGRRYDALYDRMIYPIINNYDNVIAFGGRVLGKTDFAKYKNSKESPIFSKSRTLFGINNLKKVKIEDKFEYLVIVEGYMDVIGLFDNGIRNVVASMGTSLTEQQARLLKRYCGKIYICYDGDFAGQQATARGMDILYSNDLEVFVLSMPDGMDPDEYVIKYGQAAFKKLVADAETLFDYKIRLNKNAYDLTTNEGRGKFAIKSLMELQIASNDVEALPYIERIADISSMDKQFLLAQFRKKADESIMQKANEKGKSVVISDDPIYIKALEFVLYCLASGKSFAKLNEKLSTFILSDEHLKIYEAIEKKYISNEKLNPSDLFDLLPGNEIYMKIMNKNEVVEDDDNIAEYYKDSIKKLKLLGLEGKIKKLSADIENGKTENKIESIKELNTLHKLFKVLKGGI